MPTKASAPTRRDESVNYRNPLNLAPRASMWKPGRIPLYSWTHSRLLKYRSKALGTTSAAWPSSIETTLRLPVALGPFYASSGVPLAALAHIAGSKTCNIPEMPQRNADAHGSNLSAITGSISDHSQSLHSYMPQFVVTELERIGKNTSLQRRATSRPPESSRTFSSPCSGLQQRALQKWHDIISRVLSQSPCPKQTRMNSGPCPRLG